MLVNISPENVMVPNAVTSGVVSSVLPVATVSASSDMMVPNAGPVIPIATATTKPNFGKILRISLFLSREGVSPKTRAHSLATSQGHTCARFVPTRIHRNDIVANLIV